MLFDSHAHLTSDAFNEDIDVVLQRAQHAKVATIVNIATSFQELEKGIALSKRYPWILNAAAIPPHSILEYGDVEFEKIAEQAKLGHLVAIGETGLDYHYHKDTTASQKIWLHKYLELAEICSLPVVIHCREAFSDLFQILDEHNVRGVLHCFTGTLEEAKELISRGWYISFSGILTFKKSEELRHIASKLPLENILIETDAPYLAPLPFRSKKNEPSFILETAKCLALLKGFAFEQIVQVTTENSKRCFFVDANNSLTRRLNSILKHNQI